MSAAFLAAYGEIGIFFFIQYSRRYATTGILPAATG